MARVRPPPATWQLLPWCLALLALQNDSRSMSDARFCTRRRPARRRWPVGGGTGQRARAKRPERASSRAAPRGAGTCARGGRSGQLVAHAVLLSELITHPDTCVDSKSRLGTTGWFIDCCSLTTLSLTTYVDSKSLFGTSRCTGDQLKCAAIGRPNWSTSQCPLKAIVSEPVCAAIGRAVTKKTMSAPSTPVVAYSRGTATPPLKPQRKEPSLRLPTTRFTDRALEKNAAARGMSDSSSVERLTGVSTCSWRQGWPFTKSPTRKHVYPGSDRSASALITMRSGCIPLASPSGPLFSGGGPPSPAS
mmetsp:Transcript_48997/g.158744  ORF Transcript_48997/g.158744 Transcript_48997/m.158744 type:complete len:305 (+) Transcript_48997:764-1678(+)